MPVEMDSRAAAEEQGYFQQLAALPCEACSACGLCEITSTKIDFMGNISNLSDVNEAEKPKLEMLFKMAGFEQKILHWDESVGDTGKFEFTRFGRTFKGELHRSGDIILSVELVQSPVHTMEQFHQMQKSVAAGPAEISPNSQSQGEREQTRQTDTQTETVATVSTVISKTDQHIPIQDTHIAHVNTLLEADDYTETIQEYHEEENTEANVNPVRMKIMSNTKIQEIHYVAPQVSDVEHTVLPSSVEYNQWKSEKPFEDWQITPLRSISFLDEESTPAASDAVHTESVHEMVPQPKPSDSSEFDSTISVSLPEEYLLTEPTHQPSIPDRENVLSMVETHKHAEREMFNFISEIQAAIDIQENTQVIHEKSKRETTIPVETSVSDVHGEAKNIHFAPTNQSEHVIIQYLIAAKARIQIASGQIQLQHTSETTGDISVKENTYSISQSGKEHTISIVVKNDATLEIIGTVEALRALGILLLELQLAQTKHAHTKVPDLADMETAPEEISPITIQSVQISVVEEYVYFLRYLLWMAVSEEIEKSHLLNMCL